jgi:hypothetical protein
MGVQNGRVPVPGRSFCQRIFSEVFTNLLNLLPSEKATMPGIAQQKQKCFEPE